MKKEESAQILNLLYSQDIENILLAEQLLIGLGGGIGQMPFLRKYCPIIHKKLQWFRPQLRNFKAFASDSTLLTHFYFSEINKMCLSEIPPLKTITSISLCETDFGADLSLLPDLPALSFLYINNCPNFAQIGDVKNYPELIKIELRKINIVSLKGLPIKRDLEIICGSPLQKELKAYRFYQKHCDNFQPNGKFEYKAKIWDAENQAIQEDLYQNGY